MKRGKKYNEVTKSFDKTKKYSLDEASKLLPGLSISKFEGSIEIHLTIDAKSKKKECTVRGSITLPHQTGASKKVAVIAESKDQKKATDAGADKVGLDDLIKEIEGGKIDFDVLIATPEVMPRIASLGRVLGPKGLLPNPKNQTVTTDIERVVKSYKAGKLDFKMDEAFGIHAKIGRTRMTPEQIKDNLSSFLKAVLNEAKIISPTPFKSVVVSPSMGPGVKIETKEFTL
ncbi:50S ribosomal protein L1 [Candidatus Dojkabacteria bacterium]|nr:50S ribosomal protein L1 [Candidatus Dojkabacteria bacterium]